MSFRLETTGLGVDVLPVDDVVRRRDPLRVVGLLAPSATLTNLRVVCRLADLLQAGGCRWVAVFGAGAEQIHDLLDDCLVEAGVDINSLPNTTWHENESPEEVLGFVEHMVLAAKLPGVEPSLGLLTRTTGVRQGGRRELVDLMIAESSL